MKNILITCCMIMVLSSCGTTLKFPVSAVTPAAEISVTKNTDKNNNILLTINAENLTSADRLTPSRNTYVVWISTSKWN